MLSQYLVNTVKIILSIVFLLFITSNLFAQKPVLNAPISLNITDSSLSYVLEQIENQSGANLSYSPEQIQSDRKISYQCTNKALSAILSDFKLQFGVEHTLFKKQIVLSNSIKKSPKTYTLSGYIGQKNSQESMIGATIYIPSLSLGTSTNAYGFFSLSLPEGKYEVEYSFIGYEKQIHSIELFENQLINIELRVSSMTLKTVKVFSDDKKELLEGSQMSTIHLQEVDINKSPALLGEPELIKTMQHHPGIQSQGDGSIYYYVRGGNRDQNLVLLDEAPIYNPSHLLGFFSLFTANSIKDAQFYKSDIPLKKGGVLSSILDVHTKDGNMEKFSGNGSFGPIASRIGFEGPLIRNRVSYFVNIRRSHLKWLLPKQQRNTTQLYFFDFQNKLNWKINQNNRVFLSLYHGVDEFSRGTNALGNYGISWSNSSLSSRWNHIFSEKLFSNTTLYFSAYQYRLFIGSNVGRYWLQQISNLGLKSDFSYYFSPKHRFNFGSENKSHFFNPGNITGYNPSLNLPFVSNRRSGLWMHYLEHDYKGSGVFSFRYGLRINRWINRGPAQIYAFDQNNNIVDTSTFYNGEGFGKDWQLEPRFSLRFKLDSGEFLKASYNRNAQFIQLISDNQSPFNSLEVWLPSGPNISTPIAHQLALGYQSVLKKFNVHWQTEIYGKYLENQLSYKSHPNLLLNPGIEGEITNTKAIAYGLETQLEKHFKALSIQLAYTYARIKITDNKVGISYPAVYDRPHQINLSLQWACSQQWSLSTNFIFLSGMRFTSPTAFYRYLNQEIPYYGKINNDQLPSYHRLDLSLNYHFNKNPEFQYQHSLAFSLYNIYGRKNPAFINFNKINQDNNFVVPSNYLGQQERINTDVFLLRIVPSLNYQFWF